LSRSARQSGVCGFDDRVAIPVGVDILDGKLVTTVCGVDGIFKQVSDCWRIRSSGGTMVDYMRK